MLKVDGAEEQKVSEIKLLYGGAATEAPMLGQASLTARKCVELHLKLSKQAAGHSPHGSRNARLSISSLSFAHLTYELIAQRGKHNAITKTWHYRRWRLLSLTIRQITNAQAGLSR
jgi:hypothetical protein